MRAKGKRAGVLSVALAFASVVPVWLFPGTAVAGGSNDGCVDAALAGPKLVEAWVRHPGDRKTQSIFLEADWPELPGNCEGEATRVPSVRFQLQNPVNHAQWINVGSFVRPERDLREVTKEVEEEMEAAGASCWEESEAGKTFICDADSRLTNRGGKATAYAPKAPGWPDPDPKLDRYRYRCTPGPGKTQARALINTVVKDPGTGKVIAQQVDQVRVKIKSYPRPPHPGHPKRAALKGPC